MSKRVILYVVKEHLIPHVAEKTTTHATYEALVDLFQSDNMNGKLIFKSKLKDVQISKIDNVTNYLVRITHIHDQRVVVGEIVLDAKLQNMALSGFPKS